MVRSYLVAADRDRQVKAARAAFLESMQVPDGTVSIGAEVVAAQHGQRGQSRHPRTSLRR